MTTSQVEVFFQDYVAAFVAQDIDRICALWGYPAFMTYDGQQRAFDPASFKDNAIRLCGFYADQGMTRAEKDMLELVQLTPTVAAVKTADRMYRRDGSLLASWTHAYLLSEAADGIRIVAAMPDDENRAWKKLASKPT